MSTPLSIVTLTVKLIAGQRGIEYFYQSSVLFRRGYFLHLEGLNEQWNEITIRHRVIDLTEIEGELPETGECLRLDIANE